jgi:hypothetical protein
MTKTFAIVALGATCLCCPAAALAQGEDRATAGIVTALYVEEAPGVLVDARLLRARSGTVWAEVRREQPGGPMRQLVRLRDGARPAAGDRIPISTTHRARLLEIPGSQQCLPR